MPGRSEIVTDESMRLDALGIPYLFINCYDGVAVTVLDSKTMRTIIAKRNQGTLVSGRFVAQMESGTWTASYIDRNGIHRYFDSVTEMKAYRIVLDYPVGHQKRYGRYGNTNPRPKVRKIRSNPL